MTSVNREIRPDFFAMPEQGRPSWEASRRSQKKSARNSWRVHVDLLTNASSLAGTTVVTSALGFAYWAYAARLFSQTAVGYGSAAVSVMTLLGTIGMLGFGTLLIGELPRRAARAELVAAALFTSAIGSLILGVGFCVGAPVFSKRFNGIIGSPAEAAILVAGVILTGVTLVFDQATIGVLRGDIQLWRNVVFSIVKLLVLPVMAIGLHDSVGLGIVASWVAAMALSLIPAVLQRVRNGRQVIVGPNWGVLRSLGRTTLAHNWLNLSISIPRSLIPVLVTVTVSASANAAFYAAWTLSGFLYIIPTHLSTVLFALAAADPKAIARKLRFTLRLSLFIGIPGMALMALGANWALRIFGPNYAREATVPLLLLVMGYLPSIPKAHYIAVSRATGQIARGAAVLTAAAIMEVVAASIGGIYGGVRGLTVAYLGVLLLEGLITAYPVYRATLTKGRHRSEPCIPATNEPTSTMRPIAAYRAGSHRGPEREPRVLSTGTAYSSGPGPADSTRTYPAPRSTYGIRPAHRPTERLTFMLGSNTRAGSSGSAAVSVNTYQKICYSGVTRRIAL
jgi:O-antigen/teichoic acid export membrane protein